jgi:hypothetical protein
MDECLDWQERTARKPVPAVVGLDETGEFPGPPVHPGGRQTQVFSLPACHQFCPMRSPTTGVRAGIAFRLPIRYDASLR